LLISCRFPNAVSDFKSALAYKKELYPTESEIIAEAHYKLSLALEFASITTTKDEDAEESDGPKETHVDEAMREEAAKELEAAIESTKLKLQSKEVELASSFSPEDNEVTTAQIAEVREIIADMEQRVSASLYPLVMITEIHLTDFINSSSIYARPQLT
jgi:HAT1-interacting factor 1